MEKIWNINKHYKIYMGLILGLSFVFDLSFSGNGALEPHFYIGIIGALIAQMALMILIVLKRDQLGVEDVQESIQADQKQSLKQFILDGDNLINGAQILILYMFLMKIFGSLLLREAFFEVTMLTSTLLFFLFAAFIVLPILKWNKTIEDKRLRNQIQGVLFLLILFWMTMDRQSLDVPSLGHVYLIRTALSGVDYSISILVCQYIRKLKKVHEVRE